MGLHGLKFRNFQIFNLPVKFNQFNCDNASSIEPPPLILLELELPMNGMCGNRFAAKSMRSSAIEFCKKSEKYKSRVENAI